MNGARPSSKPTTQTVADPAEQPRAVHAGGNVKPDFDAIRKRIAKRFPKTIAHLAK